MNDCERISEIWILALDSEKTAVTEILRKATAEIAESRATRCFKRTIIGIWISDILCKCCARSARPADTTVKNADLDLREAKAEFIQESRTKCVGVGHGYLTGITNLIACAESGSRQAGQ